MYNPKKSSKPVPESKFRFDSKQALNGISMTTVEIAELTGKRPDHVLRDARVMLEELYKEVGVPKYGDTYIDSQNKVRPCYRLPKKEIFILVTGYSIPLRGAVFDHVEYLEEQIRARQPSLPDFADPAAAARAWADELEQKILAEKQRDYAIKTKAHISHRREATAMATASKAVRNLEKIKAQLGDSKIWKQVKAIPWITEVFHLDRGAYIMIGKQLSKESRAMGYKRKPVASTQYGTVKAYHADVIDHFRWKLANDLNFMKKYRVHGRPA